MKCVVKAYYNTGFTFNNVPDGPALLETVQETRTFDSVYVKQDRDIVNLKIATTYENIKNADYISLKTTNETIYYFVMSVNMINDNVANLKLLEDVLTTEGGAINLTYIDGWCTRRSVTDDTLFANVIQEDYAPQTPLVIEPCTIGLGTSNYEEDFITVIASTVDLESEELYKANIFVGDAAEGNYTVTVPNLPALTQTTKYRMAFPDGSYLEGTYPSVGLYILGSASTSSAGNIYNNDGRIEKAIRTLRSLGLESVIVGSYKIPTIYIDSIQTISDNTGQKSHGFIYEIRAKAFKFSIDGADGVKGFTYNYEGYTVQNNKVYSNYNNITMFNRASGDSETYNAYDIYSANTVSQNMIEFCMSEDLSPNGCPFVRPRFYKGAEASNKTMLDNCVSGGQWLNTPIAFSQPSGNAINAANYNLIKQQANADWKSAIMNYRDGSYYFDKIANALSGSSSAGLSYTPNKGPLDLGKPGSNWDLSRVSATPNLSHMFQVASNVMDMGGDFTKDELYIESLARKIMSQELRYNISQNIAAPDIRFANISNTQIYWGNLFAAFTTRLSETDLKRFDQYLTKYGYKVSEPLSNECFTGRENFNFVEAHNVAIGKGTSLRRKNAIERIFNMGVRVWHKLPLPGLLYINPITGGTNNEQ